MPGLRTIATPFRGEKVICGYIGYNFLKKYILGVPKGTTILQKWTHLSLHTDSLISLGNATEFFVIFFLLLLKFE